SLDRANAVAAELIRRGVPAEYIDVSAHGAENPVYAEYSATGEAGNRRAEVFLDYAGGS
ncbi:MAG TPA: flagellar motor protein MotB, partial [Rhodospirillaceae bacterium]|nr:flagellar motor protein MotB [Rhodospirillaceae bacterium]